MLGGLPILIVPVIMSGWRLARAEYRAAVKPAGPDPMMMTLRVEDIEIG